MRGAPTPGPPRTGAPRVPIDSTFAWAAAAMARPSLRSCSRSWGFGWRRPPGLGPVLARLAPDGERQRDHERRLVVLAIDRDRPTVRLDERPRDVEAEPQ